MIVVRLAMVLAIAIGGLGTGHGGLGRERVIPRSAPDDRTPNSQSPVPSPQSPVPGSDLRVYLVTMGAGEQVWMRFGHNAIRIVDTTRGTDSVYNWGTFDFKQPHFLRRFMTGNTQYWMTADGMAETVAAYRYWNRSVWEQELDLTPEQRAAIRDYIAWNARPENLYYRYDYYLDNCSTRVRDIIDRIVGGQVKSTFTSRLTNTTYRFHTQRLLAPIGYVALGTNIGLGEVADRPLTEWQEAFLPQFLMEHLREVRIPGPDGSMHPLVKNERQLFASTRAPELPGPPSELVRNLSIGVVVAGLLALLARGARSGNRGARTGFAVLATVWTAINGILGAILIIGWTATRHQFMARNENMLQFDVLSLLLAVVLPFAISRGAGARLARTMALLIAAIATVGFVMQVLPWFDQVNGEIIALTLPAHLVTAWAVRALVVAPETAPRRGAAARAAISRSAA